MMKKDLPRIVFMGSPEFALPTLQRLSEQYTVVGVVTQPDRPAGRGQVLTPPPVKTLADSLGIPTIQPPKLRVPEAFAQLEAWYPDLIVVTAFGQILRQNMLDLPPLGCINVHASLLPRWRGAAPIQAAILHGDEQTGVTIMRMDPGVDTGPMLTQKAMKIEADDTAESLSARLAEMGAELLVEILPDYLSGKMQPKPQPEEGAAYASMLKKEDGQLDFQKTAQELERQVRAFDPWPGTYFEWNGQVIKVLKSHLLSGCSKGPGSTGIERGLPVVGTVDDCLVLDEVQPAGKKPMPGKVFLNGARQWGQIDVQGRSE